MINIEGHNKIANISLSVDRVSGDQDYMLLKITAPGFDMSLEATQSGLSETLMKAVEELIDYIDKTIGTALVDEGGEFEKDDMNLATFLSALAVGEIESGR